jgi:hypothetical protein
MNQQEALEWATGQNVVKVRALKENEEEKFTFMVGEYMVSPLLFDSYEEAEEYLQKNFNLTNLDLSIIGAMCQKLNNIYKNQQQ